MVMKIFKLPTTDSGQIREFLVAHLSEINQTLLHGGVIIYPTETVYGLGVDIQNTNAIDKLFDLKGRPGSMPVAVAVSDLEQVRGLAEVTTMAENIITNCPQKPITILLKAKNTVNPKLTGGSDLIGFRFPKHPVTEGIIKGFGPVTATSANLHGATEPVEIGGALDQFGDEVDIYIDSGPCELKIPSTVIDISGNTIKIIRHGACSGTELEECLRGK
jgi:L-threonylcarbamoyladenylate synthase